MNAYVSCAPDALYPAGGLVPMPEGLDAGGAAEIVAELYPAWRYRWPLPDSLRLPEAPRFDLFQATTRPVHGAGPPSLLVRVADATLRRNVLMVGPPGARRAIYESHPPEDRLMAGPLDLAAEAQPLAPDGPALYVGNQGSFNYGHWLLEDMPRLKAVATLRHRYPGRTITLLLPRQDWFNNRMRERATRLFLGPERDVAIRFVDPDTAYALPALYWASPVKHGGVAKSPAALAHLDAVLRRRVGRWPAATLRPRAAALRRGRWGLRLFVDRNPLRGRSLLDRAPILALLAARGFRVLDTERMGIPEQVALFAAAEAVVGIKGAGLVNTVFCRPGTNVVHLAPDSFPDPYYRDIAAARRHGYHALYGEAEPGDRRDHLRDFRIDPADLARVLDRIGAHP